MEFSETLLTGLLDGDLHGQSKGNRFGPEPARRNDPCAQELGIDLWNLRAVKLPDGYNLAEFVQEHLVQEQSLSVLRRRPALHLSGISGYCG